MKNTLNNGYEITHHGDSRFFRLEKNGELIAVFTYKKGAVNVAELLTNMEVSNEKGRLGGLERG